MCRVSRENSEELEGLAPTAGTYSLGSGQNWAVSSYDATTSFSQTYTSLGLDADMSVGFESRYFQA